MSSAAPSRARARRAAPAAPHPITLLPFVRDLAADSSEDKKRCFWHVSATGDYWLDNELGETLARKAIAFMRSNGFNSLLSLIVRDMTKRGQFGGVEVGFMEAISSAAIRGCI